VFIPNDENMNLLLRYATHLDRALDRALDQLERFQGPPERRATLVLRHEDRTGAPS
jgi:hypothetical protein